MSLARHPLPRLPMFTVTLDHVALPFALKIWPKRQPHKDDPLGQRFGFDLTLLFLTMMVRWEASLDPEPQYPRLHWVWRKSCWSFGCDLTDWALPLSGRVFTGERGWAVVFSFGPLYAAAFMSA